MLGMDFAGVRIEFSDLVLEETTERLFPDSRHRSARIRKKLMKRHGGEFRREPCIWKVGDRIIAHTSFRGPLLAELQQKPRDATKPVTSPWFHGRPAVLPRLPPSPLPSSS